MAIFLEEVIIKGEIIRMDKSDGSGIIVPYYSLLVYLVGGG